ncbi:MAG: DEAD/DEAH box helicase [Trueperaceae bacterium]|nr:DEAD/DEAH box helicase [Trueperaceae bacterium]
MLPACLEDAGSYHAWLRQLEDYREQIAFFGFMPGRAPRYAEDYDGVYGSWLEPLQITPYRHQAATFRALEAGHNVVVATPTASGKSLCYQLPTLRTLSGGGSALYLFPTKALAHDQLGKLHAMAAPFGLQDMVASYDGDTPRAARADLRRNARCLFSNPDMIHYGVLPYHRGWSRWLGGLELIVIDELHSYRGVFGTHVANLLRRLLRIAEHYGARPQIVAASATIGNPAAHARNLTGRDFVAVSQDDAAQAERELIFWQPARLSAEGAPERRRSLHSEAAALAAHFAASGLKSIFFCNSRLSAELVARYASDQLPEADADRVQSYRAGYTADDRRALEEGFRSGAVRLLSATSALELGVDIGDVDAVVLVGYPGSLTALWQRAGRAGRRGRRALTLLIPAEDPLDSYYLRHPEAITEGRLEHAVADAFNTEIWPRHVRCAAAEKPVTVGEDILGTATDTDLAALDGLVRRGRAWSYERRYPHRAIALRGSGGPQIRLRDGDGKTLGVSDPATALRELHPGAVYLHQGDNYLVRNLDLAAGEVVLLPHIDTYYTRARSDTDIEMLMADAYPAEALLDPEHGSRWGLRTGRVRVSTRVTSYVRKRLYSDAVLDERGLELPDIAYPTQALWFSVAAVAGAVPAHLLPSALHALEHTLIGLLPAFVLCERADVGGVSYPLHPASGEPLIVIYDGYPGGVGYARAGAARFRSWLGAACELLRDCPCPDGCPRCILSPKCGNGNQYLDKAAARQLAEALLAHPVAFQIEA